MQLFTTKPRVYKAVQYRIGMTGKEAGDITFRNFGGTWPEVAWVETEEGMAKVLPTDWVLMDQRGKLFVWKDSDFRAAFEEMTQPKPALSAEKPAAKKKAPAKRGVAKQKA